MAGHKPNPLDALKQNLNLNQTSSVLEDTKTTGVEWLDLNNMPQTLEFEEKVKTDESDSLNSVTRREKKLFITSAGACTACEKRSSFQPGLFDNEETQVKDIKHDKCLNFFCWQRKGLLFVKRKAAELRKEYPALKLVNPEKRHEYQLSDMENKAGIECVSYEMEVCSAKDGKALPVLFTTGSKMGELGWIRKVPGQTQKNRPTDEQGNVLPTPLSDRRTRLNKRRNAWVIEQIKEALRQEEVFGQSIVRPKHWNLVSLAQVFGIAGENGSATWNRVDKLLSKKPSEQDMSLWGQVRITLSKKLDWYDKPSVNEAKKVCLCSGLDFKALSELAVIEFPDPKAWALLNENGTPKRKGNKRRKSDCVK